MPIGWISEVQLLSFSQKRLRESLISKEIGTPIFFVSSKDYCRNLWRAIAIRRNLRNSARSSSKLQPYRILSRSYPFVSAKWDKAARRTWLSRYETKGKIYGNLRFCLLESQEWGSFLWANLALSNLDSLDTFTFGQDLLSLPLSFKQPRYVLSLEIEIREFILNSQEWGLSKTSKQQK